MPTLATLLLLAHSWYPPACCNGDEHGGDCHPVPCAEIHLDPSFPNQIEYHGHALSRDAVRQSPDGQCHVCLGGASNTLFCAWMPQGVTS